MSGLGGLSLRGWLLLAAFQIIFGVAVFAFTRDHYITQSVPAPASATTAPVAAAPATPLPDDPDTLSTEADRLFGEQRFQEAEAAYRKLLGLRPGDVDAANDLGLVLHYTGRTAAALELLEKGVALDGTRPRLWLTLGFVRSQAGDRSGAGQAFDRVLALQPEGPIADEARRLRAAMR